MKRTFLSLISTLFDELQIHAKTAPKAPVVEVPYASTQALQANALAFYHDALHIEQVQLSASYQAHHLLTRIIRKKMSSRHTGDLSKTVTELKVYLTAVFLLVSHLHSIWTDSCRLTVLVSIQQ